MRLTHQTLKDSTLRHQVIFEWFGGPVSVNCNCRKKKGWSGDPTKNLAESRGIYNNPEFHVEPFDIPEDLGQW